MWVKNRITDMGISTGHGPFARDTAHSHGIKITDNLFNYYYLYGVLPTRGLQIIIVQCAFSDDGAG